MIYRNKIMFSILILVGVLYPSPHGDNAQNIPPTYQGGRRLSRGAVDRRVVFFAGTGVSVVTSRRMNGKGKQPRDIQRTLHVLVLEGKGNHYTGVTRTATYM